MPGHFSLVLGSDLPCLPGEDAVAPWMGMGTYCGSGLRSQQAQCIFIVRAKNHVPQTSMSKPTGKKLNFSVKKQKT